MTAAVAEREVTVATEVRPNGLVDYLVTVDGQFAGLVSEEPGSHPWVAVAAGTRCILGWHRQFDTALSAIVAVFAGRTESAQP